MINLQAQIGHALVAALPAIFAVLVFRRSTFSAVLSGAVAGTILPLTSAYYALQYGGPDWVDVGVLTALSAVVGAIYAFVTFAIVGPARPKR